MAKIALLDYLVAPSNPIGGCNLRMLQHLHPEHEFTVFSAGFENPAPDRITWVRVPAPTRPLALLYVTFHLLSPIYFWAHRLRRLKSFDLVQTVEGYSVIGKIAYAHFCHRAYLRYHWRGTEALGLRRWLRWLDHRLRAFFEPIIYRKVVRIVVPSRGLAGEMALQYPRIADKLMVIANPVDVEHLKRPAEFDRDSFRESLGVRAGELLLVFTALGHFERKGLPLLLDALSSLEAHCKLVVVGGQPDLVREYTARVRRMGLADRVIFAGMQRDVRPYLWGADAFVFPSSYETFSLSSFEAAAAGLPVLATRLHGLEEMLRDGENGFLLERTAQGIREGVALLLALSPAQRHALGQQAQLDAQAYDTEHFVARWRAFYHTMLAGPHDGLPTSSVRSTSAVRAP